LIAEVEVKDALDSTAAEPVTHQMIRNAMREYVVIVPNIETVESIAIEFFNDDWAGEDQRGDRNLWIKEILVNESPFLPSAMVAEIYNPLQADVSDELAVLYANGRFRIDRSQRGWPDARYQTTARLRTSG
jgi:hypothetical protein